MDMVYVCIRMYVCTYVLHTCIIRICMYNNVNNTYIHTYIHTYFMEVPYLLHLAVACTLHMLCVRTYCQSLSVQEIMAVSRTTDFEMVVQMANGVA